MGLSNLILICFFAWGYLSGRRGFYLALIFSSVLFVYLNLYHVVVQIYSLTKIRFFPVETARVLSVCNTGIFAVASLTWLYGTICLVRSAVKQASDTPDIPPPVISD